jgi:membrane protease YdiL (CAAX protease family)
LIVTAAVLAPFAEELFFRGILLPALAGRFRSTWAATMVTAIAFGAMHYAVPQTVPALIALGLALGYVYLRTRSLTLSILIHMVFNAKSILWLALGAAS